MIEIPNVLESGFNGKLAEGELRILAAKMNRMQQLPDELTQWHPARLRAKLCKLLGISAKDRPSQPPIMEVTRTIPMDGYRVLCISYLSRPGVRVTGNLYVPDGKGKFPAVINMHGHWAQGRGLMMARDAAQRICGTGD